MEYKHAAIAAAAIAFFIAGLTGYYYEDIGQPAPTLEYRLSITAVYFWMVFIPTCLAFFILAFLLNRLVPKGAFNGRKKGYDRLVAWIEKQYGSMPIGSNESDLDRFLRNVIRKEKEKKGDKKIKGLKEYVDKRRYVGLLKK